VRAGPVTTRRMFIVSLASGLLGSARAVEAQQAGKVYRIGFLEAGAPSANQHFLDAFKRGLRELGYVEGQNVVIEERWAEGQNDRFPALVAELIQLRVDLLVVTSTSGAVAAKTAATTIPIVFVGAADPVGNGLVASLGRPGANLTGFSQGDDLGIGGKRLAFLKEAVPKLAQVAVLWNPTARGLENRLKEIHGPAATLKVTLKAFEVREASQLDGVFAAIARARVDGLAVLTDPLTLRHRTSIVNFAAKSRLPAVYGFGEFARAGGLMVYGANIPDLFRRAALYADRILKGARPADLPVEEPTKFELVINLKAAKAIGLTVPQSLLARADEIIQ
jgi:putative tryptophan/tyrosine transport system substrate-binding protein